MPDNVFDEDNKSNVEIKELDTRMAEHAVKPHEELVKKAAHADQFIDFLKNQLAEKQKDLEELLAENSSLKTNKVLDEAKKRAAEPEPTVEDKLPALGAEDIQSLIEKTIAKKTSEEAQKANVKIVDDAVKQKFGEKAQEFVKNKAEELGLSLGELGQLAAKSPAAFFNIIGFNTAGEKTIKPITSSINSEALGNHNSIAPGTWAWYENLRKTNKVEYYSPAVQRKMFKDREKLGENFYK